MAGERSMRPAGGARTRCCRSSWGFCRATHCQASCDTLTPHEHAHNSGVSGGRSRKSATACGAWAGGPTRTTTSRGGARPGRRARLQLLRHRVGVRQRQERAAPRRDAAAPSGARAVRRDQGPAEEHDVARRRDYVRWRRLPAGSHPRVHGEEPENLGVRRSTCSSFTSGATPGPTTSAGSVPSRISSVRGSIRAASASASTGGSRRTCCDRSRTGQIDSVQVVYNIFDQAPEDELFRLPALDVAVDRARAVRRGRPDRHPHPPVVLARGGFPEHLLQRTSCTRRWTASNGSSPRYRRAWTCPSSGSASSCRTRR